MEGLRQQRTSVRVMHEARRPVVLGQVRFAEPGGSLNVDLLTSKGAQVQGTVRESLAAARE